MDQYTNPKSWGPHFWFTMRCVAYNYPNEASTQVQEAHRTFYLSFGKVLPCERCRSSYIRLCNKYPISMYLHSKKTLMDWVELIYQETEKEIKSSPLYNKIRGVPYVPPHVPKICPQCGIEHPEH